LSDELEGTEQVEALEHAMNLVEDGDFQLIAERWMRRELTRDEAFLLLGDLLERPAEIKLPVLRAVAASPGHLLAGVAKDLLAPMEPSGADGSPDSEGAGQGPAAIDGL